MSKGKDIIFNAVKKVFSNSKIKFIKFNLDDFEEYYIEESTVKFNNNFQDGDKQFYKYCDFKNSIEQTCKFSVELDLPFSDDLNKIKLSFDKFFDSYIKDSIYGLYDFLNDQFTEFNLLSIKDRKLFFNELNCGKKSCLIKIDRNLKLSKKELIFSRKTV